MSRKAPSVLVADDDQMTVQLLSARLRKAGYAVTPAYDAMQAFMYAGRAAPDIVLVDVNMPGGGGLGVLSKLKSSAKMAQVPVVAMSVSTDPALPAAAAGLGAEGFLRKPVDFDQLFELLEQLIGKAP